MAKIISEKRIKFEDESGDISAIYITLLLELDACKSFRIAQDLTFITHLDAYTGQTVRKSILYVLEFGAILEVCCIRMLVYV